MQKFDFDEQDRQQRKSIKVLLIALFIAALMLALNFAGAQNLREIEFEKGTKTYIALPTETQFLDVICAEIDSATNQEIFKVDCLFFGAQYCMFTNQNDTAVVISRTGSRHLVLLKNCNWRKKNSSDNLKYFENE